MPDHTALDPHTLDTSPLCGALHVWPPLTVQVASPGPLEPLWDALVRGYHYLGYQKLLGHRLKYLACLQDRPVAALAFSAPARTLRVHPALGERHHAAAEVLSAPPETPGSGCCPCRRRTLQPCC